MNTDQENYNIIQEMIATARHQISRGTGTYFLIWGYVICTASLLHYVIWSVFESPQYGPFAWILVLFGAIASILFSIRQRKHQKVWTYTEAIINDVWIGFTISIILLGYFSTKITVLTFPIILLFYGLGLFVSGKAYKFLPLVIGGIICWSAAIVAFHVGMQEQLLVLSFAVLFGYIVPGHLLNKKANV